MDKITAYNLKVQKIVENAAYGVKCELPDCDKAAAEDTLCFDHQQEMEQAQREWETDKAVDEMHESLYGHPRSAETYEEADF